MLHLACLLAAANSPVLEAAGPPTGVVFFCDFESDTWYRQWHGSGGRPFRAAPERVATGRADPDLKFESRNGKALRVTIKEGSNRGGSIRLFFERQFGAEPDEIYFYYDLRLADDWNPHHSGKLPGPAGTYGRAGWGGKPSDGNNGWSARGLFRGIDRDGNTRIGSYVYHADMPGRTGQNWMWNTAPLAKNRWYGIEQYVRMNTPGRKDGILRAWVDGKLVFEKTDIRWRHTADLKIEKIWMNFWHGGGDEAVARSDHNLYLDNVAISRKPIGPREP